MPRATVLAFHVPAERLARLRMVCMRTGLLLRPIEDAELSRPIGALCSVTPPSSEMLPAPDFDGEMLLFAHMSSAQVQQFLQVSRQMKAPSFPLKAVLTPTNAAWTAGQLYAELTAERAALEGDAGPRHQG